MNRNKYDDDEKQYDIILKHSCCQSTFALFRILYEYQQLAWIIYSTLYLTLPLYEIESALLYSTLLHSTLLHSTLLYSTLLYSTLLYSVLYSTLRYSTLLYSTRLYSTLLHSILL